MKNQIKFKTGDLVYCPSETTKICQLKDGEYSSMPLIIEISTQIPSEIYLTADGKLNIGKDVCYIVHATQENYELLCKLYPNVEFEPPPKIEITNKKQAIEKYRDTPLNFSGYNKNTFYFQSESEKMCVVCNPCYVYDFEVSDKETINTLLEYLDNDEIDISIDGEFLE